MSPASMGAEIVTCWRTIVPTLAAVMRVGAMLAFVRVLSPPKVAQSALFEPAVAVPRAAVPVALRCWPAAMTEAMTKMAKEHIKTSVFINVYPLSALNGRQDLHPLHPAHPDSSTKYRILNLLTTSYI